MTDLNCSATTDSVRQPHLHYLQSVIHVAFTTDLTDKNRGGGGTSGSKHGVYIIVSKEKKCSLRFEKPKQRDHIKMKISDALIMFINPLPINQKSVWPTRRKDNIS